MADPSNLPVGYEVVSELTPVDFDFTGAMQSWAVPDDEPGFVLYVNIEGRGAAGGISGSSPSEDRRQRTSFTDPTVSGFALFPGDPRRGADAVVQVGGDGGDGDTGGPGAGGWPNGGDGGASAGGNNAGGGGGGATRVAGFDWSIGGTGGSSGAPDSGVVEPQILVFDGVSPGGYHADVGHTHARSVHGGSTWPPGSESPDNVATIIDLDFPAHQGLGYSQGEDGRPDDTSGSRGGGYFPFLGVRGEDGGNDTGQGGRGADAQEYIDPETSTNLGGVGGGGGGGGGGDGQGGGGGGAGSSNGDGTYDSSGQTPQIIGTGGPGPGGYFDPVHYPEDYAWLLGWGGGGDGYGAAPTGGLLVTGDDVIADGHVKINAWWLRPAGGRWSVNTLRTAV